MKFEITSCELLNANWPFQDQLLLSILKSRGAPIEGEFYFTVPDGIRITRSFVPDTESLLFEFKPLNDWDFK